MANVSLKHIYKKYDGGITAVSDFNLEIADKEFLILVGPSGCGKSTTLRMIAGLEEISEGELYIGDRLVNTVAPKDRDIAMVFQNYALYPHMTVYENMAFGLKLRHTPKDEIRRRVEETAQILDIAHLLSRKPKALSGGQRQRVALGRAMVREPKVFLLDEPLSNLDAKLRTHMRLEISRLHRRLGTTFVYVTHDQMEAMSMGDRIVVMKDGVIQQVDTPQNLYENPRNVFVAGFMGSPQMNFLTVRVLELDGRLAVVFGEEVGARYVLFLLDGKIRNTNLRPYIGKKVLLGIRPEHLHDEDAFLLSGTGVVDAHVDMAEPMGAETYLYLTVAGQNMVARVHARSKAGRADDIRIALDVERIHLFDRETEAVIY